MFMGMDPGTAVLTLLPLLLLFAVMAVPFMILNGIIAERKGKDRTKYILLSLIPYLGILLLFYLVSFLDKDVQDKIDKIYEKITHETLNEQY
jgi:hypothetical protein